MSAFAAIYINLLIKINYTRFKVKKINKNRKHEPLKFLYTLADTI